MGSDIMVISMRQCHQSLKIKRYLHQQMSCPKPTRNFCKTSIFFHTSGHHMCSRAYVVCWAWGMNGILLQTSNRNYQEAFLELGTFEKNQVIITCPMYVPSTCTKQLSAPGTGRCSQTRLQPMRIPFDACDALITRLSSGWISSQQCQLLQVPRTTGGA